LKRWISWMLLAVLLCLPILSHAEAGGFVVEDEEDEPSPDSRRQAWALMRLMTEEEKIGQLFFVSLEDLTGEARSVSVPAVALSKHPVGGVMLFGQNIETEAQLLKLTQALRAQAAQNHLFPLFIGVEEEGGVMSRVANKLGYEFAPSPEEIGAAGDEQLARRTGEEIAGYLAPLGINLTFAPPADTVIDRAAVGVQTYGEDPALVSRLSRAMAQGLEGGGVAACFTHFPGHGEKTGNSLSSLSVRRTVEEMRALEFIPFADAIAEEADMILVSNAIVRSVGDDMPASTSNQVINGLLRGELGYDGVVATDSLRMSAVTSSYKKGQEAVAALKAGADILLLPPDLDAALQAVRRALDTGELTMERIEQSVERILALKIRMGWIQ